MYVGGHVGQRIPASQFQPVIKTSQSSPLVATVTLQATVNVRRGVSDTDLILVAGQLQSTSNISQTVSSNGFVSAALSVLTPTNTSQVMSSNELVAATASILTPINLIVGVSQSSPLTANVNLLATTNIARGQIAGPITASVTLTQALNYVQEPLFEYLESLQPGETLTVNAEDLLVELDGVNARSDFDGSYPFVNPGQKLIIYADDESSRQIKLEIEKNDRTI